MQRDDFSTDRTASVIFDPNELDDEEPTHTEGAGSSQRRSSTDRLPSITRRANLRAERPTVQSTRTSSTDIVGQSAAAREEELSVRNPRDMTVRLELDAPVGEEAERKRRISGAFERPHTFADRDSSEMDEEDTTSVQTDAVPSSYPEYTQPRPTYDLEPEDEHFIPHGLQQPRYPAPAPVMYPSDTRAPAPVLSPPTADPPLPRAGPIDLNEQLWPFGFNPRAPLDELPPGTWDPETGAIRIEAQKKRRRWVSWLAIAAVLATGFGLGSYSWVYSHAPTLDVITVPPGATVKLDGVKLPETTPIQNVRLRSDVQHRYRLDISLHGYETLTKLFVSREGANRQVEVLTPRRATLYVDSVPTGAHIWVNGVLRGATPLEVPGLSIGQEIEIQASLLNKKRVTRQIRISYDNPRPHLVIEVPATE